MNIPFAAVTTDIKNKKEKVFTSGSMYDAVKASVAIPTVIRPVKLNGVEYVDGGVTNPVPVDHVKRMEGDLLVVSNVNAIVPYKSPLKKAEQAKKESEYNSRIQSFLSDWGKKLPGTSTIEKKLGFFDILNESIDLMQDKLTSLMLEKHKPDMLVNISREACGTFEFYKAKEMIEAGKEAFKVAKANQ